MADERHVVVIGSGPAGATAALTLLQQGIPVTMLESGSAVPDGLLIRAFGRNLYRRWPANLDQYEYSASADPDTRWYSALAPGGLSNLWTGAVPRFAPQDFQEGERLHARYRWPVGYEDVAPYYTRVERLLGVVGEPRSIGQVPAPGVLAEQCHLPNAWRTVARHAEAQGYGLIRAPMADGPRWLVRPAPVAFNSFERVVRHLGVSDHFELRLGAHAARLVWDGASSCVKGVEYVDRASGRLEHIAAAAVVVAAGPLASPKLLLQSTSNDFPHGLGNSRGILGRFLHDHPMDWCVLQVDKQLPRLITPIHVSRAAYADSTPLMAAALSISSLSKWDRLLSFVGATSNHFGVVTFGTMTPVANNYVQLHSDRRDAFGLPLLDIHIQYEPEVRANILSNQSRMRDMFAAAGYVTRLECPVERLTPGASAHYGGAVRMHASPDHGVLNAWNRLYDCDNVVVVDASCFTTGVEKNPTLTVMALAARAAERLARDLKRADVAPLHRLAYAVPAIR